MKKLALYLFAMLGLATFNSCSEDDLDPQSVIIDSLNEPNEFDIWLEENFRAPFNIQFKYRYEDIESNMTYDNLIPAEQEQSEILAKMVKYLWLDPYTEVAGYDFLRQYAPRVFHVIGTVGWNSNNTYTLGTAEGGLKITLYAGNWLSDMFELVEDEDAPYGYTVHVNVGAVNFYYLHTIHHEFAHILHQTKNYPTEFELITSGYNATWNDVTDQEALQTGFISAYASSGPNEDFVETLSYYITLSDEDWAERLDIAGDEGASYIERKLEMVKDYMNNSWNIDLDELRSVLARRYSEIYYLDWLNF